MSRLRELRLARRLTMKRVAADLGLPYTTYVNYEKEEREPNAEMLMRLADYFGVSVDCLIGRTAQPPSAGESLYYGFPQPRIATETVAIPVIGEVAAGYDRPAQEVWDGETVDIPVEFLHGRPQSDYFILNVHGDSMYPLYLSGDKVLVLKADTLEHSGQVGLMLYNGEEATLKKVEYVEGEDWLRMVPVNPLYPPITIRGADLEQCRVLGIPKLLIRELNE